MSAPGAPEKRRRASNLREQMRIRAADNVKKLVFPSPEEMMRAKKSALIRRSKALRTFVDDDVVRREQQLEVAREEDEKDLSELWDELKTLNPKDTAVTSIVIENIAELTEYLNQDDEVRVNVPAGILRIKAVVAAAREAASTENRLNQMVEQQGSREIQRVVDAHYATEEDMAAMAEHVKTRYIEKAAAQAAAQAAAGEESEAAAQAAAEVESRMRRYSDEWITARGAGADEGGGAGADEGGGARARLSHHPAAHPLKF
jgi:hypothetical protein